VVSALRSAAKAGEFSGIDPGAVSALLDALMAEEWVVFANPCLAHTESVIGYLARYTHRIAISNARILGLDDDQVSLSDRAARRTRVICTRDISIRPHIVMLLGGHREVGRHGLVATVFPRKIALSRATQALVT